VLAAVVEAEQIVPSDDELAAALGSTAQQEGVEPAELLERVRKAGSLDTLREDVATRQAMDLLAERAKSIPQAQAEAREKLWTPGDEAAEGEAEGGSGKLWTPDS